MVQDGAITRPFGNKPVIRSGVGVTDSLHAVFAISNDGVDLNAFAGFFKSGLGCTDALYLDGAISRMYVSELGRLDDGGGFVGMLGITRPRQGREN